MKWQTLGEYIRYRRGQLDLTQQDLADLIGTKAAYVSQIETGKSKWPQHLIPGLAKALGASQAELAEIAGLIQLEEDERPDVYEDDDPLLDIVMLGAKRLSPRGKELILKIMEDIENEYRADK